MGCCFEPGLHTSPVMVGQPSDATDAQWMHEALVQARAAVRFDEVPVGAVVVRADGVVVARAHNLRESTRDPLAHAEVLAIRQAAQQLERWRLTDCTLYVTLEPCIMCAGAIVHARLARVVFGAADGRAGAAGSMFDLLGDRRLNHVPQVRGGVCAAECGTLLKDFFAARR